MEERSLGLKTFFDCIFIDKDDPNDNIEYPIKLDYYKVIENQENVKAKYGLEVVKTEFIEGEVNIESKRADNIATNENELEKILSILRNNEVTPFGMQDILDEIVIKI